MDKYEKLVELYRSKLNTVISTGEWVKIDQDRITLFAIVTGDKQWIHINPDKAAKESIYKTTIAHGFLTLSMIPYLTKSNTPEYFEKNYPGMKMRINYGLNKVRFPAAVKVNSFIRAKEIPISVKRIENGVELIYKIIVEIKDNPKPACVAEQIFRLY
ncbi:MaoC family dehydratase [Hippea jasoniae]|uniref:MaoC family dehydratase n=1 Tax=Hippea jasoniae TaxID=944479 RepID=UPI0005572726|nr:MaoC family dehydratase [Hippea jasoniae]